MPLERLLTNPFVRRFMTDSLHQELTEMVHYARIAKHAMSHIKEGLIITDLDNQITLVNKGVLEIYGYENKDELVGQNISILRDDNDDQQYSEILEATLSGGWTGDVWNVTKDGRRILVELSTSAVPNNEGNPYRLMGITRDVTDKRQQEKMATLGQFSAKIIHDVNGALMPILGYASNIILNPNKADQVKTLTTRIHKSAKRLERLVSQLSNFARRDEINIGKVYLHHQVEELENLFPGTLEDKVYTLKIDVKNSSLVYADLNKINRVLQNLVANAINAMQSGGEINVSLYDTKFSENYLSKTVEIPAGKYVALSVEDNGPGIPDEVARNMFDPFYTTNKSEKSSGLGLAIVRDCIQVHPQAYLDYETELGVGTKFIIYFEKVN